MMQKQECWSRSRCSKRAIKPDERRCVEFAMCCAGHRRVHQKNIEPFDAAHCVQCTVRLSIERIRERLAHQCAAVMIARDCGEWHLQSAKKLCCMRVLFRLREIGNVAGNHHQVRTRRQPFNVPMVRRSAAAVSTRP